MLDIPQFDPASPKRVADIVGNQAIWNDLANQIRTNKCPHIVLSGPSGCGKSLFVHTILECESYHPVLTINCTANAGLRDLRDSVRGFARGSRTGKGDYRWIVLEHADALTADTQAFLRRMMETTSNTTRFLFECVDAGAIAEPILSRSSLFVVNAPDETEIRYELMRRTEFVLDAPRIEAVLALKTNMRTALLHVLAMRWIPDTSMTSDVEHYHNLLAKRPMSDPSESRTWITWAIEAEQSCRLHGLDIRELLMLGWPNDADISHMLKVHWSRLGGISTRAMFYRCLQMVLQLRKTV